MSSIDNRRAQGLLQTIEKLIYRQLEELKVFHRQLEELKVFYRHLEELNVFYRQ